MKKISQKDLDNSSIYSIFSSLSNPLSTLISRLIKTVELSNDQDKISEKYLNFLSRTILFDSPIDCLIDKCITFLLMDPEKYFPFFFSYFPQVNLDTNNAFYLKQQQYPTYISKLESNFPNPALLARCTAYFVIDKLYIVTLLRFFDKYNEKSHSSLECTFTELLFSLTDNGLNVVNKKQSKTELENLIFRRKNEIEIRSINVKSWTKVIHKLSILQPNISYYFIVTLLGGNKTKQEWTFSFNLYRCFDFGCLGDQELNSLKNDMGNIMKSSFEKVSDLTQYHISTSLFLMNLVGSELVLKKRSIKLIKEVLNFVNTSFSITPVALPIAAVFAACFSDNKGPFDLNFTVNQVVTNALDMMKIISGSSILILNTFSQLFLCNQSFFNDIYNNGIKIPNSIPNKYSLISQERRQYIFEKIISYGSFNNSLLELTNFFVSFAFLDFHSFVESNLKKMFTSIFMKFNSFATFYFCREILVNEIIKQNYPDDFSIFKENVKNALLNHIENNQPITKEKCVFSFNPWIFNIINNNTSKNEINFDYCSDFEKQNCSKEYFIKHIFEYVEPKSVSFPQASPKIQNDIISWSKAFCGKSSPLFSEEKNLQQMQNCQMLKENQSTALLFSLIPLLTSDEKIILSAVPYLYDFSTQISATAALIIQISILQNPILLEKIIDIVINQKFDSPELLYNTFYYLSIFISAAFETKKDYDFVRNIFVKIQQLIIIGICSNRNEIRNMTFTVIDLLNINEFKIFDDNHCFKQFTRKLKAITFPANSNLRISQLPFHSYRDISQTKYETIHSIYLSVIFDHLKIKFEDEELKLIKNLYHSLKLKLNNAEYKHFLVNIITFLASKSDNDDNIHSRNNLYQELNNFDESDKFLLISFASSFNDVMSFNNYFFNNLSSEIQFSFYPPIALIFWERFPTDDTINIYLGIIPKLIEQSFQNEINQFFHKGTENNNNKSKQYKIADNLNIVVCMLRLFSKMFSTFLIKHKILSSSIFLRCPVCDDICRFCHCEEKKEIILEFCLYCAHLKSIEKISQKALESFCAVTTFVRKHVHYFEYLKNYPNSIRSIFCQSPQIIELLLDQIKREDKSFFLTISSLFYPISSILESTDAIIENLNLLYYNYCCNEKNIKSNKSQKDSNSETSNDIDFSNIIYNITGKIIAICLWNFPSNDSINTLLNLTLSFALIRVFLFTEKEKNFFKNEKAFYKYESNIKNINNSEMNNEDENKIIFDNEYASLIHFLNNPTNDIQTLSNLLSSPFEFCLDQFIKEAFDLLNYSFSSNFVLALIPWMSKIDLNQNDSLSSNTENFFKFSLTSITFVENIDKFKLYELIDTIINLNQKNVEPLFILSVYLKKAELIQRISKSAPQCIDYICSYFDCNFWRYQVVQLRKLGDQFYNDATLQFLSITSDLLPKRSNSKNSYSENEDIFDIPDFLLNEVIPKLISDNFNELSFIYSKNLTKRISINGDLSSSNDFENDEETDQFLKSNTQQQLQYFKIKSMLNHILTFCITFKTSDTVILFLENNPHVFQLFKHNETTFNLLFEWATVCGDINASNLASQYLVDNFDKFSIQNNSSILNEDNINKIIQTITIITLSINNRNSTKNSQITGDRHFKYAPYYTFISTLLKLLSLFDLNYYELNKESKEENHINSNIFWFLCEFLVASDKDFGSIFGVVVDSLYTHIINNIPVNNISSISPQHFEGILSLIAKYDSIVNKNDCPKTIEQVIEIVKILFKDDKLYHLIGNLNRFKHKNNNDLIKKKKYVSTAGLFLFPFSDYSTYFQQNNKDENNDIILSKIIETFEDEKQTFDSIQKLVEKMLSYCELYFIDIIFPFYFFIIKNLPSKSKNIFDACTILLNCENVLLECSNEVVRKKSSFIDRKNSVNSDNFNANDFIDSTTNNGKIKIHKDNFLRFIQYAIQKETSNASSACSFIQSFHSKGGSFEEYKVPFHDSKFPEINLHFDIDEAFDENRRNKKENSKKISQNQNLKVSISLISLVKEDSNLHLFDDKTKQSAAFSDDEENFHSNKEKLKNDDKFNKLTVDLGDSAVYFPTDSAFLPVKFVVEIQEAACSRCKIEPFTHWDDELFNAERALDKISSSCSQPLFDDFEATHDSEYKFDFTLFFSSRFYKKSMCFEKKQIENKNQNKEDDNQQEKIENENENKNDQKENNDKNRNSFMKEENKVNVDDQNQNSFAMNDACNNFRNFVKLSLMENYQQNKIDLIKSDSSEIPNITSDLNLSQETILQSQENTNKEESLFLVSSLLFTPNEKDIDSIGPKDFPSVFPC